MIGEVIKEKLYTESSTTGAVAGYATPFAFSANKNSKGNEKAAETVGYKLVRELTKEILKEMERTKLTEGRARYLNLREYPMKNHSKVSYLIQEVNRMLKEIEYITDLNLRLKNETKVGPDQYWKRTSDHFKSINERIRRVCRKLEYLKR